MEHPSTKLWIMSAVLIGLVAAPAIGQTADGQTPAEETVCDEAGLIGASWGLCNAYCEAMDCDHDTPLASEVACLRVLAQFQRATGGLLPPCFPSPECRPLGVVDFRGTCQGGDGDRVVIVTGNTGSSFFLLGNPTLDPIVVTDLVFSDPQFSSNILLPFTVFPGDNVAISLQFQPTVVGISTATMQVEGEDGTVGCLELIGEGFPNDPPVVGACDISPSPAIVGELVTVTLEASDSATLSNIHTCTAFGSRIVGLPRIILIDLRDDGSKPGDVACDGVFTGIAPTGGALFGLGTWEFTFDCEDRQGNLATGATAGVPGTGPTCTFLIGTDTDGDGLEDSVDPCPLDPQNLCT